MIIKDLENMNSVKNKHKIDVYSDKYSRGKKKHKKLIVKRTFIEEVKDYVIVGFIIFVIFFTTSINNERKSFEKSVQYIDRKEAIDIYKSFNKDPSVQEGTNAKMSAIMTNVHNKNKYDIITKNDSKLVRMTFNKYAPLILAYEMKTDCSTADMELVLTAFRNRLIIANSQNRYSLIDTLAQRVIAGWNPNHVKTISEMRNVVSKERSRVNDSKYRDITTKFLRDEMSEAGKEFIRYKITDFAHLDNKPSYYNTSVCKTYGFYRKNAIGNKERVHWCSRSNWRYI